MSRYNAGLSSIEGLANTMKITVLPGDGIGPEVTAEAVRVLRAVAAIHGHKFEFVEKPIGGVAIKQTGSPLPSDDSRRLPVW